MSHTRALVVLISFFNYLFVFVMFYVCCASFLLLAQLRTKKLVKFHDVTRGDEVVGERVDVVAVEFNAVGSSCLLVKFHDVTHGFGCCE